MSHLATLLGRSGRGAKFGLDRMREAIAALGHPERALNVVHVAGTNGKGSVCAMVESMARKAGYKTGLYTSPHVQRLNERIRIGGQPISDEDLERILGPVLEGAFEPVTFFEAMTLCAFMAMREQEVDLAIVEVGLGGRLDATNVIERPRVTAITSVGLDHANILGDNIASIAAEKAGIAKEGVPLVVGSLEAEARRAVDRVATAANVSAIIDASAPHPLAKHTALRGRHQQANASVALSVMELFDHEAAKVHAPQGLAETTWPGRFEVIEQDERRFILDCAHNEPASLALGHTLGSVGIKDATLVFGSLEDKNHAAMIGALLPYVSRAIYCPPPVLIAGRKPVTPQQLDAVLTGHHAANVAEAIKEARRSTVPGSTIVITGSIFIVGAARDFLQGRPATAPRPAL